MKPVFIIDSMKTIIHFVVGSSEVEKITNASLIKLKLFNSLVK